MCLSCSWFFCLSSVPYKVADLSAAKLDWTFSKCSTTFQPWHRSSVFLSLSPLFLPFSFPVESFLEHVPSVGWTCRQCGYSSTAGKSHVIRHVQAIHLKITFQCIYCDSIFKREDKRKDHIKSEHNLDIRPKDITNMARDRGLPR